MIRRKDLRELPEVNSYERISDSGILATNWLGPCIGTVAYSLYQNIAYVGHFGSLPDSYPALTDYLNAIKSKFGGFDGLRVVVREATE